MGESHARSMDTGWNPGGEVWPVPVECLLNGMAPPDAHLMFGSNAAMFSTHFRHRFQPSVHLSTAHLAPMPNSINVNVSIPLAQHSMVETSQVDPGNVTLAVQGSSGQDLHGIAPEMSMDGGEGMEESEDGSEEDEEDEVEDVPMTIGHNQQHHPHAAPMPMPHNLESEPLVSCQQQQHSQVIRTSMQHPHQTPILPIDATQMQSQCVQQKPDPVMRESIHSHTEHLNSLPMGVNGDFTSQSTDSDTSDPNSGFSVHGKMYFEGRVVMHLKQWMDTSNSTGFGGVGSGFSSCAEPQYQKGGCAVCRLKSPTSQDSHRNQKEAHRHTVKGVLFTFEDCIIVELYPEPPPGSNQIDLSPKPPPQAEPQAKDHPVAVDSYMTPSVTIQQSQADPAKKFLQHMDVNCLGSAVHNSDPPNKHNNEAVSEQPPTDDHSWWDDFESNDVLKRDGREEQNNTAAVEPSCISEIKLATETHDDHPDCEFRSSSNSDCSSSFLTHGQMESQDCHSVVPLEEVDLSSDPSSSHVSVSNETESVAPFHASEESQVESETEQSGTNKNLSDTGSSKAKQDKIRHQCPSCEESFTLKRLLKRHVVQVHLDETHFNCPNCDEEFCSSESLKKHVCLNVTSQGDQISDSQKVSLESPPSEEGVFDSNVEDSEYSVENQDSLKQETSREFYDEAVEECLSNQENNEVAADHRGKGNSRSKGVNAKKKNEVGRPFKCDVCDKSFTVERRLQNHKLSHNTERSSQCEKCGKRFARKDKLMRHMYVHSEEKMFSCHICQKRFSRRDKLSDHLKSHGGADDIHNCPMCQKQFLRPDILKQHVKLHTMGNKHQCPECLRFVTGKDRLEKHMARHKEAKALGQTLLCPLCTKYFIQKQSLKAHVKKFHPHANINLDGPEIEGTQQQLLLAEAHKSDDDSAGQSTSGNGVNKSKPFKCQCCPRTFAKKQALKKHMRKHDVSPSTVSDNSPTPSPLPVKVEVVPTSAQSLEPPAQLLTACAPLSDMSAPQPMSACHPMASASSDGITSDSPPDLNTNNSAHIAIIQQTLSSAQCSSLQQPPGQDTHTQHHLSQHLLTHSTHPGHGSQLSPLGGPGGHLHSNLSHHVTVPTMQHHVSMAAQSAMCAPYVLAYPHYSYQ